MQSGPGGCEPSSFAGRMHSKRRLHTLLQVVQTNHVCDIHHTQAAIAIPNRNSPHELFLRYSWSYSLNVVQQRFLYIIYEQLYQCVQDQFPRAWRYKDEGDRATWLENLFHESCLGTKRTRNWMYFTVTWQFNIIIKSRLRPVYRRHMTFGNSQSVVVTER